MTKKNIDNCLSRERGKSVLKKYEFFEEKETD